MAGALHLLNYTDTTSVSAVAFPTIFKDNPLYENFLIIGEFDSDTNYTGARIRLYNRDGNAFVPNNRWNTHFLSSGAAESVSNSSNYTNGIAYVTQNTIERNQGGAFRFTIYNPLASRETTIEMQSAGSNGTSLVTAGFGGSYSSQSYTGFYLQESLSANAFRSKVKIYGIKS
jgi:hypothetical protein